MCNALLGVAARLDSAGALPFLFDTVQKDSHQGQVTSIQEMPRRVVFSETARLQMSITRVLGSRLLGTLVPVDGGGPPGGRAKLTSVEVRILPPPLV